MAWILDDRYFTKSVKVFNTGPLDDALEGHKMRKERKLYTELPRMSIEEACEVLAQINIHYITG